MACMQGSEDSFVALILSIYLCEILGVSSGLQVCAVSFSLQVCAASTLSDEAISSTSTQGLLFELNHLTVLLLCHG